MQLLYPPHIIEKVINKANKFYHRGPTNNNQIDFNDKIKLPYVENIKKSN